MFKDLPVAPVAFYFAMLRPFRRRFGYFFLVSALGMVCFTASPFVISQLIDHLIQSRAADSHTWLLVGIFALLRFGDEWLWRAAEAIVRSFLPQMYQRTRTQLFESTLHKTHRFFVNASSGQIGYWINNGADMVRDITENIAWTIWNQLFSFSLAVVFLAFASWKLALIFGVWIIGLTIVLIYRGRRMAKMIEDHTHVNSEINGRVVDATANNLPVRVFNATQQEITNLGEYQKRHVALWRRSWAYALVTNGIKGNSAAVVSALALMSVVHLYTQGEVSIGNIALFITYVTAASETIWSLSWALDNFTKNYGNLKNATTNLLTETNERTNGRDLKTKDLAVTFRDVTFAYHDQPDMQVLNGVDVHVKAGERIGIVGHSGAGKSTIVGLLLGLNAPTGGQLLFNDTDIAELSLGSIRRNCTYVPQDTSLFNRTIRENIEYGVGRRITKAELYQAAERAQALEFIKTLPHGFDSLVGERGVKLSGGQRQRIAITRAMLSRAPLVILDEATSALDSVSEQHIQSALNEVMKGRTAIVIAHRLSTLKHLDRIIVLDKGRVVEAGTHDELIATPGVYADLWHRQKNGFLGS